MGFGINFYECGTVLEMFNAFITDVLTVDVSTWPFELFNTEESFKIPKG
jgi:hypothetical protein